MPFGFPRFPRETKVVDHLGMRFPSNVILTVDDVTIHQDTYSYLVFPEKGSCGFDMLEDELAPAFGGRSLWDQEEV